MLGSAPIACKSKKRKESAKETQKTQVFHSGSSEAKIGADMMAKIDFEYVDDELVCLKRDNFTEMRASCNVVVCVCQKEKDERKSRNSTFKYTTSKFTTPRRTVHLLAPLFLFDIVIG